MKNLLLTLVVALFATSFAFSQTGAGATGTGTVSINVVWADIFVNPLANSASNSSMYPGSTWSDTFVWQFGGTLGAAYTVTPGTWTGTGASNFDFSGTLGGDVSGSFPAVPTITGGFTSLQGVNLPWSIYCKPGTPRGAYNFQYSFAVNYN